MAKKKKVTSPKRKTAKDYMPQVIDLGNGIKMQARLRLGGIQYLEDKYDCGFAEIPFETGRIKPVFDLLVAILMGEYPDKTLKELEAIVKAVDLTNLQDFSGKLRGAITTESEAPKKSEQTEQKAV